MSDLTRNQRARGQRRALATPREDIIRDEVADAMAATPAERMDALIALLDSAYELWIAQGFDRDEGLCRLVTRHFCLHAARRDGERTGPTATFY